MYGSTPAYRTQPAAGAPGGTPGGGGLATVPGSQGGGESGTRRPRSVSPQVAALLADYHAKSAQAQLAQLAQQQGALQKQPSPEVRIAAASLPWGFFSARGCPPLSA